jgi:hypothetical protein
MPSWSWSALPSWSWTALLLALTLSGCAAVRSYEGELGLTLQQASMGNVDGAIRRLEANTRGSGKDVLYYFELGMLQRLGRRYEESDKAWLTAQALIEARERSTLAAGSDALLAASSYLISDKMRTYEVHDYEKVMLLTYIALNHLAMGRYDDARVAIKQTHELEAEIAERRARQIAEVEADAKKRGAVIDFKELNGYPVQILDNPEVNALKNSYQSALSHYLAGFVYESLGEPSLAAPGYRLANELQPHQPALEEALRGLEQRLSAPDDGMTDVLFLVSSGTAPILRAQQFMFPVIVDYRTVLIPVSFPVLLPSPTDDAPTGLVVGGAQRLTLTPIASIDLMARRGLKDDMPGIMLRAAIRSTASAVLQVQAQRNSNSNSNAAPALGLAIALASAVLQTADDRTWRTLPAAVYIARARLPPGVHVINVQTRLGENTARVNISGRHAVIDFRVLSRQLFVQARPAAVQGE